MSQDEFDAARGCSGLLWIIFVTVTAVFIALKLAGVLTWSWWVITSPLWGPFAFGWICLIFSAICMRIAGEKLSDYIKMK